MSRLKVPGASTRPSEEGISPEEGPDVVPKGSVHTGGRSDRREVTISSISSMVPAQSTRIRVAAPRRPCSTSLCAQDCLVASPGPSSCLPTLPSGHRRLGYLSSLSFAPLVSVRPGTSPIFGRARRLSEEVSRRLEGKIPASLLCQEVKRRPR